MSDKSNNELELVWTAAAIAALIGRSERQTFHLLEKGILPARKIGGTWTVSKNKIRSFVLGEEAA